MPVEKQAIPIIKDDSNNPIAGIFFIGRDRILCKIERMTEEEIVNLLQNQNK